MIRTVKKALPVVVFIILAAGVLGLWLKSAELAVLVGGTGVALVIPLLFFAVISWDDAFEHKKKEALQLANVVNHAMDAIVIFDVNGKILYANDSAISSYDIHRQTQDNQTIELIGLEKNQQDSVLKSVLDGKPWNGELTHESANGGRRIHLVNIFLLDEFHKQAPAMVTVARDLTRRKELERQLMHSQKLAAIGGLAAGVAHEMNNPLAAIQSQIGLAKDLMQLDRRTQEDREEIRGCIDTAGEHVDRCSRIVDSLLRFSRRQEPQLSEFDLNQPILQAVRFFESLPRMENVKVVYDAERNGPVIRSDASSICQILINLMTNAADATQREGRIQVYTHRPSAKHIAIEVIDQGDGIKQEHMDRVFEPFFTTKPLGEGTGLGLSISYGIAESLGGQLRLASPPEGGTVATLILPLSHNHRVGDDSFQVRREDLIQVGKSSVDAQRNVLSEHI